MREEKREEKRKREKYVPMERSVHRVVGKLKKTTEIDEARGEDWILRTPEVPKIGSAKNTSKSGPFLEVLGLFFVW